MILPIQAKNPPERMPWATCVLLAANILAFAFTSRAGEITDQVLRQWSLIPRDPLPITFLTSSFLHADFWHLLGNMWFLYLFGFSVEGRMGWLRYTLLYLLSGLAGSLLHVAVMGMIRPDAPAVGASGCIMGVVGAAMFLFPHSRIVIFYWFGFAWRGTFELALAWVGLFYVGMDLAASAVSMGMGGVAHFAHLGGAAAGFVLVWAMRVRKDSADTSEAKAIMEDVGVLNLGPTELSQLGVAQPDSLDITLRWAQQVVRRGYEASPDLVERLGRHQEALLEHKDQAAVVELCAALPPAALIRPSVLLDAGRRAERIGRPDLAATLYENVYQSPLAVLSDQQMAAFRTGMLFEVMHHSYERAAVFYRGILTRWPGSPLEESVRARLSVVEDILREAGSERKPA